jgi:hypothetical protein
MVSGPLYFAALIDPQAQGSVRAILVLDVILLAVLISMQARGRRRIPAAA